jgi:hypothetical protein
VLAAAGGGDIVAAVTAAAITPDDDGGECEDIHDVMLLNTACCCSSSTTIDLHKLGRKEEDAGEFIFLILKDIEGPLLYRYLLLDEPSSGKRATMDLDMLFVREI